MYRIVIDTNVVLSALKSKKGASYTLIKRIPSENFDFALSVPLYTEYQDVLTRAENMTGKSTEQEILSFIRYLCKISIKMDIFFLWRPWLRDPKDDMILELAVTSKAQYIVTYNLVDFKNIDSFGVKAIRPGDFLKILNEVNQK
jgi:putative PIN family toxin of toxin-antitoxin system